MKINKTKWCVSCILPFRSVEVIRIVHSNGRLEEIRGGPSSIQASDLMGSHPNQILKRRLLTPTPDGFRRKIVAVPPDAELKHGEIYFLMPDRSRSRSMRMKRRAILSNGEGEDRYLKEILAGPRVGRRVHGGAWRPSLESIRETRSEII